MKDRIDREQWKQIFKDVEQAQKKGILQKHYLLSQGIHPAAYYSALKRENQSIKSKRKYTRRISSTSSKGFIKFVPETTSSQGIKLIFPNGAIIDFGSMSPESIKQLITIIREVI